MVVPLLVAVVLLPDTAAFSPDNHGWEGTSRLAATRGLGVSALPPSQSRTAYLQVVWQTPDRQTQDQIATYLRQGGLVVLLDDMGGSNEMLSHLGVPWQVSSGSVVDPLFNAGDPSRPTAGPVDRTDAGVAFDHPSALLGAHNRQVLLETSPYSFLNGARGIADYTQRGPFVLASEAVLGRGTLVLVTDPSIITNAAQDRSADRQWLNSIIGRRTVFLAQSSVRGGNLGRLRAAMRSFFAVLGTPWVALATLLLILVLALRPAWRALPKATAG
jgi:hypothetical protein